MSREEQQGIVQALDSREMKDRTFLGIIALAVLVLVVMVALAGTVRADDGPTITVDGQTYTATKVTPGGTVHFETPDTNPQTAFTDRNTWTGNGSEHLPCEGGIHWIDNKNVLTISNCLESEATTTTTLGTTTSTVVETTTTSEASTTTSTVPVSSTTQPETSSTTTPTTSPTTPPSSEAPTELPYTGTADTLLLAAAATALIATGVATLRRDKGLYGDDG